MCGERPASLPKRPSREWKAGESAQSWREPAKNAVSAADVCEWPASQPKRQSRERKAGESAQSWREPAKNAVSAADVW
ncbi:hypothetical protein HQN90_28275 [Paenibacillus alba]|nr:hypothetical protein [Paenibacillus alba]